MMNLRYWCLKIAFSLVCAFSLVGCVCVCMCLRVGGWVGGGVFFIFIIYTYKVLIKYKLVES